MNKRNKILSWLLILLVFSGCTIKQDVAVSNIPPLKEDSESLNDILAIISKEEEKQRIPKGLLKAIATVESGCSPYTVNANKKSYRFKSFTEAAEFVNNMVYMGKTNMSIGCCQIHYKSHKKNFSSINSMLSPQQNISYAATLLKNLHNKYKSWEKAVKKYHNNKHANAYYRKIQKAIKAD
ncbi:MAG: transglycosylase SLT domain-containing protein [Holosporales bacterium]|nr:transglycosylase SLT domain-containing protein [Holosporales bacterium]